MKTSRCRSGRRAVVQTPVPGPKSQALRQAEERVLAPGLQRFASQAGIVVDQASGSLVTDVDGNRFIDIIGGIGVNGLGHSHPGWVSAVQQQAARASVGSFTSKARIELLEGLAKHRPAPDVACTQLYSSGAEAVESALRLAKSATSKSEFVSFSGGFHGKTLGARSLAGGSLRNEYGKPAPGHHLLPYADCFRCPLKLTSSSCDLACVDAAREQLKSVQTDGIAAFMVEPMQGTAGNVIPPDDWLPAIAALAREFDALLIVDEMITGFGRTGRYWGVDHSGCSPDVVTIGKQMGGGFPISGVMAKRAIAEAPPWSNPSGASSSYGGNPLASAAAAATLRIIDDEDLVQNSKEMGDLMLRLLAPLPERYPFIGEVRGRGLFIGIELVRDKATKEPLPDALTQQLFSALLERGLLTMAYTARVRIQPAMTIDRGTVEEAVHILTQGFDHLAATVGR